MLTIEQRELVRQAQVIQYNNDYDTFEFYIERINNNESLSDEERDELEYLALKYNWEIV
jgi:hypothetical protein